MTTDTLNTLVDAFPELHEWSIRKDDNDGFAVCVGDGEGWAFREDSSCLVTAVENVCASAVAGVAELRKNEREKPE